MAKPAKRPAPSSGELIRRGMALGLLGVAGVAIVSGLRAEPVSRAAAFFRRFSAPTAVAAPAEVKPAANELLHAEPLSDELKKKGYHECFPHDPMGLGPYTPFKNLSMGRIAIPQVGGHTPDMGFDVLIQFHGHSPVRKTFVQVTRGLVYVGIDKGLGSGPYSDAFGNPDVFTALLKSIEAALKRQSGDPRAHIRKLALSAWSAGYGAVNEILKYGDDRVDAVVLLDGLHAAWNPAAASHDAGISSLSSLPLGPTFRFAKKAARGEKWFVFTHSEVVPETYPSTRQTADLLLAEVGVPRTGIAPGKERFSQTSTADLEGFHVWGFRGSNEHAHCSHVPLIERAVHLLEGAWQTPAMDRNVPFTPAPVLGVPAADGAETTGSPLAAALTPPRADLELLPRPAPQDEPVNPQPSEVEAVPPAAVERPRPEE
ncbi:MAG: hypothetical protein IT377_28205 [Polyangiaceae bacterium]|nr:hypothetical protein [Polyangiaceae bacterium]